MNCDLRLSTALIELVLILWSGALDSGWSAMVVFAAFVVHCIVDGISYSFAVFYVDLLNEYSTDSHAKLVLVGTLLPATCLFVGQSLTCPVLSMKCNTNLTAA